MRRPPLTPNASELRIAAHCQEALLISCPFPAQTVLVALCPMVFA
jgi:hypothetical protein